MSSEHTNNPLTEVALALSMAFFSLMVLTIFALSQKDNKSSPTEKLTINSDTSTKMEKDKEREIIFYFNENFYDKNFKKWEFENKNYSSDAYTIAVPSNVSVKKLFQIKKILQKLDIKITQQNNEWNDALIKNIRQKGIKK